LTCTKSSDAGTVLVVLTWNRESDILSDSVNVKLYAFHTIIKIYALITKITWFVQKVKERGISLSPLSYICPLYSSRLLSKIPAKILLANLGQQKNYSPFDFKRQAQVAEGDVIALFIAVRTSFCLRLRTWLRPSLFLRYQKV